LFFDGEREVGNRNSCAEGHGCLAAGDAGDQERSGNRRTSPPTSAMSFEKEARGRGEQDKPNQLVGGQELGTKAPTNRWAEDSVQRRVSQPVKVQQMPT
jgi:hypothetical protein